MPRQDYSQWSPAGDVKIRSARAAGAVYIEGVASNYPAEAAAAIAADLLEAAEFAQTGKDPQQRTDSQQVAQLSQAIRGRRATTNEADAPVDTAAVASLSSAIRTNEAEQAAADATNKPTTADEIPTLAAADVVI